MRQRNFSGNWDYSTKALRSSFLGVFVEQCKGQHGTKQVRGYVVRDEEEDMAAGGQADTQGFVDNSKDFSFCSQLELSDML